LNNVRGRDELEIVLNKAGKETEEKYDRLARLDLAIKYSEKPFIAHANCQQKLDEIWYTGIRKISKMNHMLVFLLVCLFIILLPFITIVYIFAPNSKVSQLLSC
jgi:transient receptor potential cation channel subfamily C protein 4